MQGDTPKCFAPHLRIEHIFIFFVNKLHFRVINY